MATAAVPTLLETTCPSMETRSPDLDATDTRAEFNDVAEDLVSDDQRRLGHGLRPGIPSFEVRVASAHARAQYPNENLTSCGGRFGHVHQLQARPWLPLDQCAHAESL